MNLNYWLLACRPKTLTASICPVLVGLTLAIKIAPLNNLIAGLTLLCAILIQITTNFANDYFDFKKGGDTKDRLGPERMVQTGKIAANTMKQATIITLLSALLIGLFLAYSAGWPIFIIGILSLICAILYTGGPFSLAYTGTSDLFVLTFFGPIAVMGTVYIQHQLWSVPAAIAGLGLGLIATAILAVNNIRDYQEDKQNNKKTIVVRLGQTAGKIQYCICIGLPILLLTTLIENVKTTILVLPISCICFLLIRQIWIKKDAYLNPLLGQTGLYLTLYSITLILVYLLPA